MDKQTIIAAIAETADDQMLLAKIHDKISAGQRRNIPSNTCFLTGREQILAQRLLDRTSREGVTFFGGTGSAERKVCAYVPEYYEASEYLYSDESPVAALRAVISSYDTLTHRDFLGGILGQGIKREILGDIFVSDDHCDFLVLREMAPYLLQHLTNVGRARIQLSEIALSELEVPEQRVKVIRDTVASLRLDSIIASGFQMGRSKAQGLIAAGKTELNHLLVTKADKEVSEGDVISVRGLGKMRVAEIRGLTKKGRTAIVLERYL